MIDDFDDIVAGYQKIFPKPPLVEPTPMVTTARRTKRKGGGGFVMVPMAWKDSLNRAKHAATLKIALHVLFTSWQKSERSIPLGNRALSGIPRRSKWKGLSELERLGLVTVERRPRRAPMVTILPGPKHEP